MRYLVLMDELSQLLSESTDQAKSRESREFDRIAGGRPIVLFGAGAFGKRTLTGLRTAGIEPLAFCDNNRELWGCEFDRLPVLPLGEAVKQHPDAAFVISIWSGHATDSMADRERQIVAAGARTVLHWGPLYWKYQAALLPHYAANSAHRLLEQADAVRECAELWADDYSKREYLSQVRWRLNFDFDGLGSPTDGPVYFRDELRPLSDHEVFVDCGAYDGNTVISFLDHSRRSFSRIFAFEPDPANFAKLSQTVAGLPEHDRITVKQAAVGRVSGRTTFSAGGGEASAAGSGTLVVECVALDEYFDASLPSSVKPTYIKLDIEGFELEALDGAKQIIKEAAPMLAVCSYHAQDHLWKIPLQIRKYNPEYRFYLRPHLRHVWDLVCYAVPGKR